MKFGRYMSFLRELLIVLGAIFVVELFVLWEYAAFVALFGVICLAFFYYGVCLVAKQKGGEMGDYIVMTEKGIELHTKKQIVPIKWSEVVEIRQITPARGMREVCIIASDGTQISFASNGGREKQIWKMHPELKSKLKTSRM